LRDLKALFDKHDFNSFPVVDAGKMVGIVIKFDFLSAFVFTTTRMVPPLRRPNETPSAANHDRNRLFDAPGRVHQSVGPARRLVEQTDWHDREERAFLTALANRLHDALSQDETSALTIVAATRALGMLRDVYSPAVRRAIRVELRKDLVKTPRS
jgi:protein required for attachment to host cells